MLAAEIKIKYTPSNQYKKNLYIYSALTQNHIKIEYCNTCTKNLQQKTTITSEKMAAAAASARRTAATNGKDPDRPRRPSKKSTEEVHSL